MAAKKTMGDSWNSVTPFSKFVALAMFVLLPMLTYVMGIQMGAQVGYEMRKTQESYERTVTGPATDSAAVKAPRK